MALWAAVQTMPFILSPYHEPSTRPVTTAQISVVSLNLWADSPTTAATLRYLENTQADVIGLVEVTPAWLEALQPLLVSYPFQIGCPQPEMTCDTLLLSKRPFRRSGWTAVTPSLPSLSWGEIEVANRPLVILETHPTWPFAPATPASLMVNDSDAPPSSFAGVPHLRQGQQIAGLANYVRTLGPDLVVMGNFNSAPWSHVQNAFRQATGLQNAPGYRFTWPRWIWPVLRLPIDQIFVRGGVEAASLSAGPAVDSDHLPVSTVLTFRR